MSIPDSINHGIKIEEEVLWRQDLPVEEIPIDELEYNLDICYLEQLGTDDWNLSPRMLIESYDKETFHATKSEEADLQYPIEIYYYKDKRIILDGVHRFTKAMRLGNKTIKVRRVPDELVQEIKMSEEEHKRWKEKYA